MNPIVATAVVALLIIIRFAVPCALIAGVCYALDRLAKRWETEARLHEKMIATD